MPRDTRTHLPPAGDEAMRTAPRSLTKDEFARRLYKRMVERGWTQSELSRQAGLNRDAVSTYVRGVSFPTPVNLDRLAKALGVEPAALLPNIVNTAIERDTPELELKVSPARPDEAYIRINRRVSMSVALQIFDLISKDTKALEAAD